MCGRCDFEYRSICLDRTGVDVGLGFAGFARMGSLWVDWSLLGSLFANSVGCWCMYVRMYVCILGHNR